MPDSGHTSQVLAWLDASHVVVLRTPPAEDVVNPGVWVLDITGGNDPLEIVSPVVKRDEFGDPTGHVLDCCASRDIAWELATEATFKASEPPDPIHQRTLVGWSVAAVVLALVALLFWRRRVEP